MTKKNWKAFVAVACGAALAMGTGVAVMADEGTEKYGALVKTLSSEYWNSMKEGYEAKAAELGVEVEVMGANSEDDTEGQVNMLETMVQSGEYAAFAVTPLSDVNLVRAVKEANDAGYLIGNADDAINYDELTNAGGVLVCHVATDNVYVGQIAGEYIASIVPEGADVAIIEGKAGAKGGEDRKEGVTKAFEDAGLNIVDSQPADWDKTKAYDVATNLISKNENLAAIYCCNDTMAMGALQAVQASGKDIAVVGTDGNADAIESVEKGELTATVAQDPAGIGARTLELVVEAYRNGDTPGSADIIEESVDPILITFEG